VFVSVEIYTTAKLRQDYNANKIQSDAMYTKQRIQSKINYIVPLDRDSQMQTLQSSGSYSHLSKVYGYGSLTM